MQIDNNIQPALNPILKVSTFWFWSGSTNAGYKRGPSAIIFINIPNEIFKVVSSFPHLSSIICFKYYLHFLRQKSILFYWRFRRKLQRINRDRLGILQFHIFLEPLLQPIGKSQPPLLAWANSRSRICLRTVLTLIYLNISNKRGWFLSVSEAAYYTQNVGAVSTRLDRSPRTFPLWKLGGHATDLRQARPQVNPSWVSPGSLSCSDGRRETKEDPCGSTYGTDGSSMSCHLSGGLVANGRDFPALFQTISEGKGKSWWSE